MGHFITQPFSLWCHLLWSLNEPIRKNLLEILPKQTEKWSFVSTTMNLGPRTSNTFGFAQLGAQLSSEGSNTFNNLRGKFKPIRKVRTRLAWLKLVAVCAYSRRQGLKWGCRNLMRNKTHKRAVTVAKPRGKTAEHNRGKLNSRSPPHFKPSVKGWSGWQGETGYSRSVINTQTHTAGINPTVNK